MTRQRSPEWVVTQRIRDELHARDWQTWAEVPVRLSEHVPAIDIVARRGRTVIAVEVKTSFSDQLLCQVRDRSLQTPLPVACAAPMGPGQIWVLERAGVIPIPLSRQTFIPDLSKLDPPLSGWIQRHPAVFHVPGGRGPMIAARVQRREIERWCDARLTPERGAVLDAHAAGDRCTRFGLARDRMIQALERGADTSHNAGIPFLTAARLTSGIYRHERTPAEHRRAFRDYLERGLLAPWHLARSVDGDVVRRVESGQ